MLISLLLIVLLVIVGVYFFRSRQGISENSASGEKETLFSRIFGNDSAPSQTNSDEELSDADGDGLTQREESDVYKTNPNSADSDGDGMNDKDELAARRDPLNNNPQAEWPPRPTNFSAAGQQ